MPELALAVYLVYGVLAFGLRGMVQWRRTGATGFKGVGGRPGSREWLAGVGFAVAILAGVLAPVLALAGLDPITWLDRDWVKVAGLFLALAGIALTLWAQIAMGDSWRIGVDHSERTELVTRAPFTVVRNPIFAAMIPTALGLTLMVPNLVAVAALVGLAISLELQVRVVEEPYLREIHGDAYSDYAARVGRFAPWLGRLARERAGPQR